MKFSKATTMSRIGKKPISLPEKVTLAVQDGVVLVKGPKGELKERLHPVVTVTVDGASVTLTIRNEKDKSQRALWGTTGALIRNMLIGVTTGFQKRMEIKGVGYVWNVSGKKVVIKAGYSHPVEILLPEGITAKVEEGALVLEGINKQLLGETAALIRKVRKPEPYKGKGIRYADEHVRRKAGKQAATA